jgi:hypothetical protein
LKNLKKVGAKVENPQNFPVEILKSGKSSGKIRKILKKIAQIWKVPEKTRPQCSTYPVICPPISAGAWPSQRNHKSALLRPRIHFFSGLYSRNVHSGMSKGAPKQRKREQKRRNEKNGRRYHKHYHQERDPQPGQALIVFR